MPFLERIFNDITETGTFPTEWNIGSVYTNAVSHRHGFLTWKPRQNRCGLEVFIRNRLRQKIEVVRDGISERCTECEIHYFKLNNVNFAPKKFSMQFCCLLDS